MFGWGMMMFLNSYKPITSLLVCNSTTTNGQLFYPLSCEDHARSQHHCEEVVDGYRLCLCSFVPPSPSPSATPSPTPTPSVTPSTTPTPSATPSTSRSPSPSSSPTPSTTPSTTPSQSAAPCIPFDSCSSTAWAASQNGKYLSFGSNTYFYLAVESVVDKSCSDVCAGLQPYFSCQAISLEREVWETNICKLKEQSDNTTHAVVTSPQDDISQCPQVSESFPAENTQWSCDTSYTGLLWCACETP